MMLIYEELEQFLDSPRVFLYSINEDTAEFYSTILNELRRIGRPVPANDIWIASVAFQHGLSITPLGTSPIRDAVALS